MLWRKTRMITLSNIEITMLQRVWKKFGTDYGELFESPANELLSVHWFSTVANHVGSAVFQFDVSSVCPNADLEQMSMWNSLQIQICRNEEEVKISSRKEDVIVWNVMEVAGKELWMMFRLTWVQLVQWLIVVVNSEAVWVAAEKSFVSRLMIS